VQDSLPTLPPEVLQHVLTVTLERTVDKDAPAQRVRVPVDAEATGHAATAEPCSPSSSPCTADASCPPHASSSPVALRAHARSPRTPLPDARRDISCLPADAPDCGSAPRARSSPFLEAVAPPLTADAPPLLASASSVARAATRLSPLRSMHTASSVASEDPRERRSFDSTGGVTERRCRAPLRHSCAGGALTTLQGRQDPMDTPAERWDVIDSDAVDWFICSQLEEPGVAEGGLSANALRAAGDPRGALELAQPVPPREVASQPQHAEQKLAARGRMAWPQGWRRRGAGAAAAPPVPVGGPSGAAAVASAHLPPRLRCPISSSGTTIVGESGSSRKSFGESRAAGGDADEAARRANSESFVRSFDFYQ
jgi:hypothetical protein